MVILKCWKKAMIKKNKKRYIRKILKMTLTKLTKGKQKDNLAVQVLLCTVLIRVITVRPVLKTRFKFQLSYYINCK